MIELYTQFIYQPFFNLLVGIYYGLSQIPQNPYVDMGIAVIVFTIALRIILLPITFASTRSEKERRDIEEKISEINHLYHAEHIKRKNSLRKLWLSNRRVLVAEGFNFVIQTIIFFMLWRIFAKGLEGADIHLLYGFMPDIPQPYNLMFLGKYDLAHPNITLNIIQSITIFVVEFINIVTSPFPTSRTEVIRLQFILPIVSFLIFMNLPAGKKVFIITTLLFSILYTLVRTLKRALTPKLVIPEVATPTGQPT